MILQWIVAFRDWANQVVPYRPLRLLIGLAILAAALVVVVGLVRLVFNWVDRRLEGWRGRRLRAIRWQSQELLSEEDISRIGRGVGLVGRRLAYLFVFLAALQLVFVLVPETEPIGRALFAYVAAALSSIFGGLVAFVPNAVTILVLYLIASYMAKFAKVVFRGIEWGRIRIQGFERDWAPTTFRIIRGTIWVLFVVVAFPYLPFAESPAFQGLSIFFGVLFSLGGTQMMANLIAGVMLTYTNAFKIGDWVRIADAEGVVVAKTAHVTRIRTAKNVTVSVPNALVINNHIINFTAIGRENADGVVVHTTITIGYDVAYQRVEELLLEAAGATDLLADTPEPFVLQTSLDDFYVSYQINAYTNESKKMPRIRSDLHRNIQRLFHAAGVEIASPHLSALRDGNVANIPDESLPKNYRPTAFRVLPLGGLGEAVVEKATTEPRSRDASSRGRGDSDRLPGDSGDER